MNPNDNGGSTINHGPIVEIAITGIHLLPGLKGPEVKVLARVSDGLGFSDVQWFDLRPDEKEAIVGIVRGVERRLLEGAGEKA